MMKNLSPWAVSCKTAGLGVGDIAYWGYMRLLRYTDILSRLFDGDPKMVLRLREEMNRLIIAATIFVLSNQPAWSAITG